MALGWNLPGGSFPRIHMTEGLFGSTKWKKMRNR